MYKTATKFFSLFFISLFFLSSFLAPSLHAQEAGQSAQNISEENEKSLINSFSEDDIQEVSYWKEFARMMMILGTILAIVLLLAWLLRNFLNKRVQHINQSNIIKVLERRNLSQKSMIYLIEVYNKQILIGDSASGGVEFLMECKPSDEELSKDEHTINKSSKFSFIEILQRKLTEKQLKPIITKNDQKN